MSTGTASEDNRDLIKKLFNIGYYIELHSVYPVYDTNQNILNLLPGWVLAVPNDLHYDSAELLVLSGNALIVESEGDLTYQGNKIPLETEEFMRILDKRLGRLTN